MFRRLSVWGAALVLIVVALQLATRTRSDGGPDALAVLEQAPLRLPTGPRAAIEELQRQAQPTPTPGGDDDTAELPAEDARAAEPAPAADGVRRFLFDCGDGVSFAVRTTAGEAAVLSPQALGSEVLTLPQVEAGSGTRYTDGTSLFSSRGGLATFEVRGRIFPDCTSNPGAARSVEARRGGAMFRALGNEPPWVLEISPALLTVTTEQGAKRTEFPHREPSVAGARTTYRSFAGTQELVVVIDRTPCNDTMSGEAFDNMVAVTFEGTTLYGCGRIP
jgi:putative lipoprotein